MANSVYDKGLEAFGNAGINWLTDVIKVQLIDTAAYIVNPVTDEFLSSIAAGARIGTPVTLATKTNVAGALDAADVSVTAIVGAPTIEALVIYKDTGVESTSRLIAYIDTATGLPLAAGATQVDIVWSNLASKILKL